MPGEKKMCLKTGVSSSIGGYLSEALEKDAKLGRFIQKILNDGPASSSSEDDSELSHEMMLECASAHVGSSKSTTSFVEEESNSNHPSLMFNDLLCMSAVVEEGPSTSNTTSDDASLTLYFAEPTELDKECGTAHVKRLKREWQHEATKKRKTGKNEQKRMFTGKSIDVAINSAVGQEKGTTRPSKPRNANVLSPPAVHGKIEEENKMRSPCRAYHPS